MTLSNYYIKAIVLEQCSYSLEATKLLNNHKINHEIVIVNNNNKELFKTNNIQTFPQLYLMRKNRKGHLLLGGYNDMADFIQNFKLQQINNNKIDNFMRKYNWSKKSVLRLIELINIK